MEYCVNACEIIGREEKDFFDSKCYSFRVADLNNIPEGIKRGDVVWLVTADDYGYRNNGRYFYDGERIIEQEYDLNIDDYGHIPKCFLFGEFPPMYWSEEERHNCIFCINLSPLDLENLEKQLIENEKQFYDEEEILFSADVEINGKIYKFFILSEGDGRNDDEDVVVIRNKYKPSIILDKGDGSYDGKSDDGESEGEEDKENKKENEDEKPEKTDEEKITERIKYVIDRVRKGKMVAKNYFELEACYGVELDHHLRGNIVVID